MQLQIRLSHTKPVPLEFKASVGVLQDSGNLEPRCAPILLTPLGDFPHLLLLSLFLLLELIQHSLETGLQR